MWGTDEGGFGMLVAELVICTIYEIPQRALCWMTMKAVAREHLLRNEDPRGDYMSSRQAAIRIPRDNGPRQLLERRRQAYPVIRLEDSMLCQHSNGLNARGNTTRKLIGTSSLEKFIKLPNRHRL